jgi:hypothetical protein
MALLINGLVAKIAGAEVHRLMKPNTTSGKVTDCQRKRARQVVRPDMGWVLISLLRCPWMG